MTSEPRDVLVVASWYPSIGDPVAGRFVADQVSALTAAGCRVAVASFDPAGLSGAGRFRERLATIVGTAGDRAASSGQVIFSPLGVDVPPVPVARLKIPGGRTPSFPILHAAHHRTAALRWLGRSIWGDGDPLAVSPGARSGGPSVPRPAIIHAHTGYPDGVAAAALAADLGVPLVITEHATFLDRQLAIPEVRAAYVDAALRAHRLLAVSAAFADHLRTVLPEVANRVGVVPNAVDVDGFSPAEPGERRPGELLFVGYLKEIKGIDVLLRALAIVRVARPGVTLRLVGTAGDPALDARWRSLADDVGVREAVTFDPPTDRGGVGAAMRRADVFVHASRYETFGVVAAEALAAGLPVVATDSKGVPEVLGDAVDAVGAVVPVDDPEQFAAAILRVLGRRQEYDPVAIRASIVERVGGQAVAARLLALYDEAIAAAAAARLTTTSTAGAPGVGLLPEPAARPIVVVAFDPDRATLLERLAPAARSHLVVVTSAGPAVARLTGFRAVVTANLHDRVRSIADTGLLGPRATGWRRIARALRHPLAVARRRGLLPGLESVIRGAGTDAIRRGIEAARVADKPDRRTSAATEPPFLATADGIDAYAAAAVLDEGLALAAPGGLRWAADQALSLSAGLDRPVAAGSLAPDRRE
ncbi:MAG: glycosyltransferase [Chloroflexota bacterium]